MSTCAPHPDIDVVLYFYGELEPAERARAEAHLRSCTACRQRLEDLHAIRRALAAEPVVEAPPAGDWSGFMRRLDSAVGLQASRSVPPTVVLERRGRTWSARHLVALTATLALVTIGVFMAARVRPHQRGDVVATRTDGSNRQAGGGLFDAGRDAKSGLTPAAALREVSAEHLERSKLVVLGLATRDPEHTRAADWQYERQLAGTLLADTRLYRLAAQERGVSDVARVMRDLETVLLEASMSDGAGRDSLEHVQRLITRRGLVSNMQMVATSAAAGL